MEKQASAKEFGIGTKLSSLVESFLTSENFILRLLLEIRIPEYRHSTRRSWSAIASSPRTPNIGISKRKDHAASAGYQDVRLPESLFGLARPRN